jgi:hypothetical protein
MATEKNVVAGLTPDHCVTKLRNGPALRHVGALPASNNHNFEEEFLLGEDKITVRWYEGGWYWERTEYRKKEQTSDYYYTVYIEYDTQPDEYDVTVEDNKMIINLHNKMDMVRGRAYRSDKNRIYLYYKHKNGSTELINYKDCYRDYNDLTQQVIIKEITRSGG